MYDCYDNPSIGRNDVPHLVKLHVSILDLTPESLPSPVLKGYKDEREREREREEGEKREKREEKGRKSTVAQVKKTNLMRRNQRNNMQLSSSPIVVSQA